MSKTVQYASAARIESSKVDIASGIIKDVALMTVGEASGHDQRIDQKTLEMFYALVKGKTVKAFINHTEDPRPTEAVGLYSGFYIDVDGAVPVLRASQFQALRSFKENSKGEFETLFEMADKAPESFGISANFYHELEDAEDGGNPYSRPTHVESFDIVCTPAANNALFSSKTLDVKEKQEQQRLKEIETQSQLGSKSISTMKAVFAHFKNNPKALAHIAKFAEAADEKTTDADLISKVEMALNDEEASALIAERDDLKAKVDARDAEIVELKAKIAELDPKAAEVVTLSAQVVDLKAQLSSKLRFGLPRAVNTGAAAAANDDGKKKEEKVVTGIDRVRATFAKQRAGKSATN